MALDTHKAVKMLQQAGFGEGQAEAVVTTVSDALNETVATKADLLTLEAGLRSELQEVRSEMRALEQRMTIKLGGLLVIGLGLMTALDKLLSIP